MGCPKAQEDKLRAACTLTAPIGTIQPAVLLALDTLARWLPEVCRAWKHLWSGALVGRREAQLSPCGCEGSNVYRGIVNV